MQGGYDMKKTIAYGLPILILGAFILLMTGGSFLKRPRNQEEDVLKYIAIVKEDVKQEDWERAEQDRKKLEKAWSRIAPRIQFSVERDEMYNINLNLARLGGVILGQDKAGAFAELGDIYENWMELGR